MTEHHLAVTRTARYCTLDPPATPAREVWFVLHGYGQLAGRFIRQFEPFLDGTRQVVAPEALSRFYLEAGRNDKVGASWMTREDRLAEIADYVGYLDAVWAAVAPEPAARVTVLGFSQGTATAARWVAHGRARIDRLILWGGEFPPDLDLAAAHGRFERAELLLVVGSADSFITPKVLERDEARLREYGIAYQVEHFVGGHELVPEVLQRVAGSPR